MDAGATWIQVEPGRFSWISDIVIAPTNPLRIFLRSYDSYRSDDGGVTWTKFDFPQYTCNFAVAPSDENRIYAYVCGQDTSIMYRSDDGGRTWNSPLATVPVPLEKLIVSPTNPNLLIGASFDTIVRSVDGGTTFEIVPLGKLYRAKPVFDLRPPYTLYLGDLEGLLRSDDNGQNWQKNGMDSASVVFMPSPFVNNTVLGGSTQASWQMSSAGNDWRITAWDAPQGLRWLGRSITDSRTIYAQTDDALYRSVVTETVAPFGVFLPLTKAGDTVVATDVAQLATNRFNDYRALAGVALLRTHPALVQAAQSHADYRRINKDDSPILVIDKRMYQHRGEVANIPIHFLPVQKHLWVIHSRSRGLMECSRWISQKCATVQIV